MSGWTLTAFIVMMSASVWHARKAAHYSQAIRSFSIVAQQFADRLRLLHGAVVVWPAAGTSPERLASDLVALSSVASFKLIEVGEPSG